MCPTGLHPAHDYLDIDPDDLLPLFEKRRIAGLELTGVPAVESSATRISISGFGRNEAEGRALQRIDIQYRAAAGLHMIVELKRYGRVTTLAELVEQGGKYHRALTEVIEKRDQPSSGVNVVFVLGQEPQTGYLGSKTPEEYIEENLGHLGGRVLYYESLLHSAQQRYREYRERKVQATALDDVMASLDAAIPEPGHQNNVDADG